MKRMEKEVTQCNLPPAKTTKNEVTQCNLPPAKTTKNEVTQCNPPPTKKTDVFYLSNFDGISISLKPQRLPLSVGRHVDNDLIINNGCASRWHCSFELNNKNKIVIKDLATRNGTIVGERIIQNEAVELEEEMFIHIGGVVFQAFKIPENKDFHDFSKNINQENSQHGICVVDLCNSTQLERKKLDSIMHRIRFQLLSNVKGVLMVKNMGDGYLTIYEDPSVAFTVANKLLKWKKECAERTDIPEFNFRIALDRGPTTPTQSQDRMGMAINRASRIEKTQQHELEQPGDTEINTINRCLLTGDMFKSLSTTDKELCLYVGAKSIKGFGAELHNLYQMTL